MAVEVTEVAEEKKSEEKKKLPVIDVRTWNPGTVRWDGLPPEYVAAYLKHQFNLDLPKEGGPKGNTFKEMFETSSAEGKRFLATTVGVKNPFAKKPLVVKYTDAQRATVLAHVAQREKLGNLIAQYNALQGDYSYVLRQIDKDTAQKIVEHMIADAGPVAHLVSFTGNNNEDESRYDLFLRLLGEKEELEIPVRTLFINEIKRVSTNDELDYWLSTYAKKHKVKVEGDVEEINPWLPTWRDVYAYLRATPIKNALPPKEPEWVPA